VQRTLLGSAITEKTDCDLIRLVDFCCQTRTARQGWTAAYDAIGAEHAFVHIGNMHRAALAFTSTSRLAKESAIMPRRSTPFAIQ